jgi:hypothetical protein
MFNNQFILLNILNYFYTPVSAVSGRSCGSIEIELTVLLASNNIENDVSFCAIFSNISSSSVYNIV